VMDNEAGMEHLSRGTTQDIDELLIVSNHSIKGVRTIARIRDLVNELKLRIKHQVIVINMTPEQVDPEIIWELEKLGLRADGFIPLDEQITAFDLQLKPLPELPDRSRAVQAVDQLMSALLARQVK
jgi:CO dehydrogenase maturation factor